MINSKTGITLLGVFNLILVIGSFTLVGDPLVQMKIRQDEKRLQDFSRIYSEVNNYFRDKEKLPQSLTEINTITDILKDKETGKAYIYELSADKSYKLCTDFSTNYTEFNKYSDLKLKYMYEYSVKIDFKEGYSCLDFTVPEYIVNDPKGPARPASTVQPNPSVSPSTTPTPGLESNKLDLETVRVIPRSDPYDLESATTNGGELILNVTYGTGCPKTPQTFKVYTTANRLKVPRLYLVFDNGGNLCRALARKTFIFDLTKISTPSGDISEIEIVDSANKIIKLTLLAKKQDFIAAKNGSTSTGCNTTNCSEIKKKQQEIIERNKHCIANPGDPTCTF